MPPVPPSDRVTRMSNKSAHPGLPDVDKSTLERPIPKRRRTKDEVKADKLMELKLKKEKEKQGQILSAKRIASMKSVAELEDKMGAEDIQTEKNAARPKPRPLTKAPRPMQSQPLEAKKANEEERGNNDNGDTIMGSHDSEYSPSDGSAGEGGAGHDSINNKDADRADSVNGDESLEERNMDEDSEGDDGGDSGNGDDESGGAVGVVGRKKTLKKSKPHARDEINKLRLISGVAGKTDLSDDTETQTRLKRKARETGDDGIEGKRTKKGKKASPSGLLQSWKRDSGATSRPFSDTSPSVPSTTTPTPNPTTNSGNATSPTTSTALGAPADVVDKFDYGGYSDEGGSAYAVTAKVRRKKPTKGLTSIVQVNHPVAIVPKRRGAQAAAAVTPEPTPLPAETPVVPSPPPAPSHTKVTTTKATTRFTNHYLPTGILPRWTKVMLPLWFRYIGGLSDPWTLTTSATCTQAQGLWNHVFPVNAASLEITGEPIFSVLKQRTYEWRGHFSVSASAAVTSFWDSDPCYKDPVERAAFVEWALPDDPTEQIPVMWADVDETDPDDVVYKGAFQSPFIIKTFAHHLTVLNMIPEGSEDVLKANRRPIGALALAATAVEHAFRKWSTGEYEKKPDGFTAGLSDKTAGYIVDIGEITPKTWDKIMAKTKLILDEKSGTIATVSGKATSSRRRVVDADDSD